MSYKVVYTRIGCIGCANCAAFCPAYWKMNPDGKSDLKGSKKVGDNFEREFKDDTGLECNKKAEANCQGSVIKVVEN